MITTPIDRTRCELWTDNTPSPAALRAACGFDDVMGYRIDVLDLDTGAKVCERPGDALASILVDCRLLDSLDDYRLRIVEPNFTEVVCSVMIEHEGPPTQQEIRDVCGSAVVARIAAGSVTLRLIGRQPKPPATPAPICKAAPLAPGLGLYDQAPDVSSLWTNEPLTWLAGRMIWYGMVQPACPGGRSGLDPDTLAADGCGMDAADDAVTDWQNQFNGDIYNAAITYQVPARLIKRIIAVESQYWPVWANNTDEAGMLQVSHNGADVLLRYDPDLDADYPRRPVDQQYWQRLDVLRVLACYGCSLMQAVSHMHITIPIYARLLAAYRCRAVEIDPALSGAAAWRQAAADFNGSNDYLRRVEQ